MTSFSQFKLVQVKFIASDEDLDAKVAVVSLNRPQKFNAFNQQLFQEYLSCFELFKKDRSVRCIVVDGGVSKGFLSGIDVSMLQMSEAEDVARSAIKARELITFMQKCLSSPELCPQPVIMAIHGLCIGLGIDLILGGDIRLCTQDVKFAVKEVQVGLAADVGTLQRITKSVGSSSWLNEVCFTGRDFGADEALSQGLVSKVCSGRDELMAEAIKMAKGIASLSPVAVYGTKHLLLHARDHTVAQGLEYTSVWNGSMLQSQDLPQSIMRNQQLRKGKPVDIKFSKL